MSGTLLVIGSRRGRIPRLRWWMRGLEMGLVGVVGHRVLVVVGYCLLGLAVQGIADVVVGEVAVVEVGGQRPGSM